MNRAGRPKSKVLEELSFTLKKGNGKNIAFCKSFIVYFFSENSNLP